MKMTATRRRILEALDSGVMLELQFTASGLYNDVQKLRAEGLIKRIYHPEVKDSMGYPADALEITETGRAAIKPKKRG